MPPPVNDRCIRKCHKAGKICHRLGRDDLTVNVHNFYNINTIPDYYFKNSDSIRELQDLIHNCYKARNNCEKCKEKSSSSEESNYWFQVDSTLRNNYGDDRYENFLGKGLIDQTDIDKFVNHIEERDKAKILRDVIRYKKTYYHNLKCNVYGTPPPLGIASRYRLFSTRVRNAGLDENTDWFALDDIAKSVALGADDEPEPEPEQRNFDVLSNDSDESESSENSQEATQAQKGVEQDEIRVIFDLLKDDDEYITNSSQGWLPKYGFNKEQIKKIYDKFSKDGDKLDFNQFKAATDFIDKLVDDLLIEAGIQQSKIERLELQDNDIEYKSNNKEINNLIRDTQVTNDNLHRLACFDIMKSVDLKELTMREKDSEKKKLLIEFSAAHKDISEEKKVGIIESLTDKNDAFDNDEDIHSRLKDSEELAVKNSIITELGIKVDDESLSLFNICITEEGNQVNDYNHWLEIYKRKKSDPERKKMFSVLTTCFHVRLNGKNLREKKWADWRDPKVTPLQLKKESAFEAGMSLEDFEKYIFPDFTEKTGKITLKVAIDEIVKEIGEGNKSVKKIYLKIQATEKYSHLQSNPRQMKADIKSIIDARLTASTSSQKKGKLKKMKFTSKYFNFIFDPNVDINDMTTKYIELLRAYQNKKLQHDKQKTSATSEKTTEDFKRLDNDWDEVKKLFFKFSDGLLGKSKRKRTNKKTKRTNKRTNKRTKRTRKNNRKKTRKKTNRKKTRRK